MEFNFSSNNSMTEFEAPDTTSTIYLGFASQPETNIFSQKYFRSPHVSTTESLIKNLEKLEIQKKREFQVMIHLVQGWPTLDGSTAAMALTRDRKELESRDWLNLTSYISEMEKGFTTPPFLRSLYCFYYATVEMVSQNQSFKELPNCQMEWIDQQKARILLPEGVVNDFTEDKFLSISGASEMSCNGLFEILSSGPKEFEIGRPTDYALKNLMDSEMDHDAKSLMESMFQQISLDKLNTLWKEKIEPESKSLPIGVKVKLKEFNQKMINQFAWSTSFTKQKVGILGDQTLKERNREVLMFYHEILGAFLDTDRMKGPDAFRNFMDLVPRSFSIAAQEEILNGAKEDFVKQDYLKAERFEVDLPLKNLNGNQTHQRVPLLGLVEPQSSLFKFFARNPMSYPDSPEEKRYPLTYVHNPKNKGKASEHVISVPPTESYNLKGLSELLEKIEDRSRAQKKEAERPKSKPRVGYDYNDPWYDERDKNNSIIDNPQDGSRLERLDLLEALWHYGNPLERVEVKYATTSIFIPFWEEGGVDEMKGLFSDKYWDKFSYKNEAKLKQFKIGNGFLPFVEEIFNTTDQKPTAEGTLQAWSYKEEVQLNLEPRYLHDYGPAVSEIRDLAKQKVNKLILKAKIDFRIFAYEFGLGLINLDIDLSDKECSIMDTQWMEHMISITDFDKLLSNTSIDSAKINALVPSKHFACTTLTQFKFKGGSMTDCRSLGGGLQMVVNDAEPLFHNLPTEIQLKTEQAVVDEVTKRHYYCSSSSMLNFDESAFKWEHTEAHAYASMIFNMVLAQRFILAQSRKDIVEKEWDYNETSHINFLGWLKRRVEGKQTSPENEIHAIRERVQHMTTSSWFNVVSSDSAIQRVFEKLRNQMNVDKFYTEVQERCNDLDEFISQKQASVQSKVFDIFTFVMSPFNLVVGFMGGLYFTRLNEETHPFPFFDLDIQSGWILFLIYSVFFSILFLGVWILYKYKSFKA
ncbi:hypothetical protein OAK48_01570 [Deltaproteobacteria bacterium]|nr:hypothetical protein [Deltaproteobacteria bacterium]